MLVVLDWNVELKDSNASLSSGKHWPRQCQASSSIGYKADAPSTLLLLSIGLRYKIETRNFPVLFYCSLYLIRQSHFYGLKLNQKKRSIEESMPKSAAPSPGVSSPSLIGLPIEVQSMVLGYVGLSSIKSMPLENLFPHLLLPQVSFNA